jgi:hypothetical protein
MTNSPQPYYEAGDIQTESTTAFASMESYRELVIPEARPSIGQRIGQRIAHAVFGQPENTAEANDITHDFLPNNHQALTQWALEYSRVAPRDVESIEKRDPKDDTPFRQTAALLAGVSHLTTLMASTAAQKCKLFDERRETFIAGGLTPAERLPLHDLRDEAQDMLERVRVYQQEQDAQVARHLLANAEMQQADRLEKGLKKVREELTAKLDDLSTDILTAPFPEAAINTDNVSKKNELTAQVNGITTSGIPSQRATYGKNLIAARDVQQENDTLFRAVVGLDIERGVVGGLTGQVHDLFVKFSNKIYLLDVAMAHGQQSFAEVRGIVGVSDVVTSGNAIEGNVLTRGQVDHDWNRSREA